MIAPTSTVRYEAELQQSKGPRQQVASVRLAAVSHDDVLSIQTICPRHWRSLPYIGGIAGQA